MKRLDLHDVLANKEFFYSILRDFSPHLTRYFACEGAVKLSGWGPRGLTSRWLETVGDMAEYRSHLSSRIRNHL